MIMKVKLSEVILQLNSLGLDLTPQNSVAVGWVNMNLKGRVPNKSPHNSDALGLSLPVWEDVLYSSDSFAYNKICYGIYPDKDDMEMFYDNL